MPSNAPLIIDSADRVPPRPTGEPPHRTISGADWHRPQHTPLLALLPWPAWVVIGVLTFALGGFLVWRLDQSIQTLRESGLLGAFLVDFTPPAVLAILIYIVLRYVAARAHYAILRYRYEAYQAGLARTRLGTPVAADVAAGASWSQIMEAEQAAIGMQVERAPHERHPLLSTLSEGSHEEATTTITTQGEEVAPALPPPIVTLDSFPAHDSPTAVPLGMDGAEPVRLDFGGDTLHVGLYGASGAGKDNLLRAWFMCLTRRNTPDQVCFAVLDGKGDWLTADLRDLAHMWIPPAGGAGQQGTARMKHGIERIEAEMVRRLDLVNGAGCRDREAYMRKTGQGLPLLIVFITDGVTAVEGALTGLMNDLVSKARAVGIRVVVSMQTPTGQDMRWRLNLSTYISGHLPHPSQDLVALGLKTGELAVRPSQLPTPQQEPGLFIVRQGVMVKKVKAVYVSDEAFDGYVGRLARRVAPVADPRTAKQRWLDGTRATLGHQPRPVRLKAAEHLAMQGYGQQEIAYACKLSDEAAGHVWRQAQRRIDPL